MTPGTRKTTLLLVALLSLVVVIWLDVLTGLEASVFILYIVPVVFATWFLGLGCGLWLGLLATVAHRWADWPASGPEIKLWVIGERGLSTFVLLGFIAFSFRTFKRGRKIDRERIEQLESLLRICPACNRIHRPDGQWQSLEACMGMQPLPPGRRLCPECVAARSPEDGGL